MKPFGLARSYIEMHACHALCYAHPASSMYVAELRGWEKHMFKTVKPFYIYWAIIAYSLTPFASSTAAFAIAKIAGATLNEGGPNPCIIFGYDLGHILYSMLGFGWLAFFTLPTGFILLIIFTIFLSIWNAKKRLKK